MDTCYLNNIRTAPSKFCGGGRVGTVVADKDRLHAVLGSAHQVIDEEYVWVYHTPKGLVSVHTYWWNQKDEFSIGATSVKAARWVAGYMRALGFSAKIGNTQEWTEKKLTELVRVRKL